MRHKFNHDDFSEAQYEKELFIYIYLLFIILY